MPSSKVRAFRMMPEHKDKAVGMSSAGLPQPFLRREAKATAPGRKRHKIG